MNIKKLLITGAAAGLLFVSAGGAFAHSRHTTPAPLPTTTVSNYGGIDNVSVNVANTGLNFVSAPIANPTVNSYDKYDKHHRGGDPKVSPITVTTGDAVASQTTENQINTVAGCGCTTAGNTTVTNNGGVDNLSVNVANSGLNWVSGGSLTTGGAMAGQDVFNVINTGVGTF